MQPPNYKPASLLAWISLSLILCLISTGTITLAQQATSETPNVQPQPQQQPQPVQQPQQQPQPPQQQPASAITTQPPVDPNTAGFTTLPPHDANKELIDYEDKIIDSLTFAANNTNFPFNDLNKHHSNEELHEFLLKLNQMYPDITRLYSIGQSVELRKLWALEITEHPGQHVLLKPEFRYIANIHGNEVVGRELLLNLARLLVENYKAAATETDTQLPSGPKFVKKLLQSTRIHLLPSLNPDGYARSKVGCKYEVPSRRGRLNANNIDLNRNFPDPVVGNQVDASTQPEVLAMINWSRLEPFVLSANFHGGTLVASYPYDGSLNRSATSEPRPTPDDDVFRELALVYSQNHPTMFKGEMCYDKCTDYHSELFPNGITNGAGWYSLYGGLQDWLYENTNEFDLTLEVGCNQYPPAEALAQYWQFNKKSMLRLMTEVHKGIKGLIQDESTGAYVPNVNVQVLNKPNSKHTVSSSKYGDYYRILTPGEYKIQFEKAGYESKQIFVTVLDTMAQIHNIKLKPLNSSSSSSSSSSSASPSQANEKPASDATTTTSQAAQNNDDHSIVVATLVMTVIIILILILMAGAFVIQKRRLTRSQSVSVELQPTRSASTGISLPSIHQQQQQSGSSTNPHLAA